MRDGEKMELKAEKKVLERTDVPVNSCVVAKIVHIEGIELTSAAGKPYTTCAVHVRNVPEGEFMVWCFPSELKKCVAEWGTNTDEWTERAAEFWNVESKAGRTKWKVKPQEE